MGGSRALVDPSASPTAPNTAHALPRPAVPAAHPAPRRVRRARHRRRRRRRPPGRRADRPGVVPRAGGRLDRHRPDAHPAQGVGHPAVRHQRQAGPGRLGVRWSCCCWPPSPASSRDDAAPAPACSSSWWAWPASRECWPSCGRAPGRWTSCLRWSPPRSEPPRCGGCTVSTTGAHERNRRRGATVPLDAGGRAGLRRTRCGCSGDGGRRSLGAAYALGGTRT